MKLSRKLLVAPLVAIGFLIVLAAASYSALTVQQRSAEIFYREIYVEQQQVADVLEAMGGVHAGLYRLLNLSGAIASDRLEKESRRYLDTLAGVAKTLGGLQQSARTGRDAFVEAAAKLDEYTKAARLAIELGAVDANTGTAAMQTADIAFTGFGDALGKATQAQRAHAAEAFAASGASYRFAWVTMIVLALAAVGVSLVIALALARRTVARLARATDSAEALANGDLTQRAGADSTDEVGQMLDALSNSTGQLGRLVGSIREVTDAIGTAADELARGNIELSARTEEQASSLEQTVSSLEELTTTVKQNEDNARQANELAGGASDVAIRGGKVVHQVVQTMDGISAASRKISEIIGVIDSIAFQTNILALNAAVEAARAGEQGKGFAVVASEVRSLAQRSAAAAREIKTLIEDSVARVRTGSDLVGQAGQTMEEIVTAVRDVSQIISAIRLASQEQSVGIDQVNQAMGQIDRVTQQNAALVEEAAAAADTMKDQAARLVQSMTAFKLDGVAYTGVRPVSAALTSSSAPAPTAGQIPDRPLPAARGDAAGQRPQAGKSDADGEWKEF